MIHVSNELLVNEGQERKLTRDDVWRGLEMKANNALPFVPAMTKCEVIERRSEHDFDRDVEFRGQAFVERITLEPKHRVIFNRLSGKVLGTIANELFERDGELVLRFSYSLLLEGVEADSPEEQEYADGMAGDYLKALAATLDAMRKVAAGETAEA